MPSPVDAQNEWVRRVLGVPVPLSPAGALDQWRAAQASWMDAIHKVDGQIAGLQKALRDTGDDDLVEIAEFGLSGVTKSVRVPLMAAFMEIGAGTPESLAKAGPKALRAAQAFRAHIESDGRIAAIDTNPAGVAVTMRATLGSALARIEAALA